MPYIPFTPEQKRRANSVDLVDFLQRQGEVLTRSGREWRWQRHDSVTVRGNRWFRHSRKEGGQAIDFVQQFYGLSFPEAVTWLLGGESGVEWNQLDKSAPSGRKPFELPAAHSDMRRVFAYLIKQRCLDRDVIAHFAREKLLYEDAEHHNAVFVGLDEAGNPRHAHKRGTSSLGARYRGNVAGSDPRYSFHHIGKSDCVFVFEGPIDLLSFITLHLQEWQQGSYVALDGVGEQALLHQLSVHPQLQQVVLCLDHDSAGIEAAGRIKELLQERGYSQVSVCLPEYKDWNECLKAIQGMDALPARENPKQAALREFCAALRETLLSKKARKHPEDDLISAYDKLKLLLPKGKLESGQENEALEQTRQITVAALHTLLRECRQMEQSLDLNRILEQFQQQYRPHRDREGVSARVEKLDQHMSVFLNRIRQEGIRSLSDKQQTARACLYAAWESMKLHVFFSTEGRQQQICKPRQESVAQEPEPPPLGHQSLM